MSDRFALTQQPYHPDVLRQPPISSSDPIGDRRRAALIWNTFRTLETIAPAFWLRRLVARLGGLQTGVVFAPQTVRVRCWEELPLTPTAMMRRGKRGSVPIEVLVETEDLVLTICAPPLSSLVSPLLADTASPGLLEVAESTIWRAGTRLAFVAVLLPPEADETTWAARVMRRARVVRRVMEARDRTMPGPCGLGPLVWPDLVSILRDVSTSPIIPFEEGARAAGVVRWLTRTLNDSSSVYEAYC